MAQGDGGVGAGGAVGESTPGATGTAALLAVLDAMGLLMEERLFTHEGVLGTLMQGRVSGRQQEGGMPMVVPVIEGAASMTRFHEFVD